MSRWVEVNPISLTARVVSLIDVGTDEPDEDQLDERCILDHVESEAPPSRLNRLGQPARPLHRDDRPAVTAAQVEVEFLLTGLQTSHGQSPAAPPTRRRCGGAEVFENLVAAIALCAMLRSALPSLPRWPEPYRCRQPQLHQAWIRSSELVESRWRRRIH